MIWYLICITNSISIPKAQSGRHGKGVNCKYQFQIRRVTIGTRKCHSVPNQVGIGTRCELRVRELGTPSSSTESYCHRRPDLHSCPHFADLKMGIEGRRRDYWKKMQRKGGYKGNWQDITCTWGKGSGNRDRNLPGSHTSQDQSATKPPEKCFTWGSTNLIGCTSRNFHIPVISPGAPCYHRCWLFWLQR